MDALLSDCDAFGPGMRAAAAFAGGLLLLVLWHLYCTYITNDNASADHTVTSNTSERPSQPVSGDVAGGGSS